MNYRPITDTWILARSRVGYYGAYPFGFLERARSLLGVNCSDAVLHVCSGMIKKYPYRGFGANDKTVDLDAILEPDFVLDVRKELPAGEWKAILCDPPYSDEDALRYRPGATYPEPNALLRLCLEHLPLGRRVGMLHYFAPRPPKGTRLVALVSVLNGYKNRIRCFSVYEK